MKTRLIVLAAALGVSGCATSPAPTAITQFAPSAGQAAASAIMAALGGGLVAQAGGERISAADRRRALEAEYRALEHTPAGVPVPWSGADGISGEVVAGPPYSVGAQNCRQYTQTVRTSGRQAMARGAACRNPDGSWSPL